MVKQEDSETEASEHSDFLCDVINEAEETDDYLSEGDEDEETVTDSLLERRYKSKRVKIRQTEEGDSIQVLRLKTEDKPFTGNCIRQSSAIIYIASVLSARRKFYSDIWLDISHIFLDCVKNMPHWTPAPKLSVNISRWLNNNSIDFCILSQYNRTQLSTCKGKRVVESMKPLGRPKKPIEELKTPRPSRYVKKSELLFDNTQLMSDSTDERSHDVPLDNMKTISNVSIFSSKKFCFDVSIMNLNGIDGGLRVKDLASQILQLFETSSSEDYSTLGAKLPSRLPKLFFDNLKKELKKPTYIQTLFCGGPISAIAACPRRLSAGDELVAISTFPDEKLLTSFDETAHVQFWAYPSDLCSEAKLKFILEITNVTSILNLCWCPCFTNNVFTKTTTRNTTKSSLQKNKNLKNFEDTKNLLGFLAVATNAGKVLIYCIPSNIDELCESTSSTSALIFKRTRSDKATTKEKTADEKSVPKIFRTEPKITLEHPKITVRIDEGNQEIFFKKVAKQAKKSLEASASVVQSLLNMGNIGDVARELNKIPIIHLRWSPFRNGRMLAGISASGRVLVWDIEAKEPFNRPLVIHSLSWTSPPVAVDWFSASDLCISFRLKCIRVYNIDTETCTFKEDTSKSAGQMVVACPSIFPGFFVYDTHFLPFPDIFYSCSSYITFPDNDRKKALMVPTLNAHQVQISRISVCEGSGSVASVGYDGRLVSTLNGRVKPYDCEKVPGFYTGRTLLHLISHRKNVTIDQVLLNDELELPKSKSNSLSAKSKKKAINRSIKNEEFEKEDESTFSSSELISKKRQKFEEVLNDDSELEKLCYTHAECCENKWLEIRIGDATLKDHITMRRMKSKISDVFLDRRLESLTYVDYSHITPCLSISGGEAGLVFLMPCIF